jgi:aldose 1-epimerase
MGAVAAPAIHREECGPSVERYTFDTGPMRVSLLSRGGILHSVRVPDRSGRPAEVILGPADPVDRVEAGPHLGIMTDRRTWTADPFVDGERVGLRLECADPAVHGAASRSRATVTYTVHGTDLRIDRTAEADAPTTIDRTLFNLAGEGSGSVEGHELYLNAGHYAPVEPGPIPTGRIHPVAGTPMDFTGGATIGSRIRDDFVPLVLARGYDHTYVLDRSGPGLCLAARVSEPRGGRRLSVFTTEPCVRFYSGNHLDGTLAGTSGRAYRQGDGFSLGPQPFPAPPDRTQIPSTVLRPGETYRSSTVYRFDVLPSGA